MKRGVAIVALAATLLLASGCWDHREIVDIAIVTGIGIDRGTLGETIRVTLQAGKTSAEKSSDGGESDSRASLIMEASGRSVSAALALIRAKNSREPYLQHNQVLLVSEKQAEEGFFSHLDVFMRELELRLEVWLVISEGDAGEVLTTELGPEQLSGVTLTRMMANERAAAHCRAVMLIEYIAKQLDGVTAPVAPIVALSGPAERPELVVTGMAVFKDGRMAGRLNPKQVNGFALLRGGVNSRPVEVTLPEGYAVVQLINLKSSAQPMLQGEEILLKAKVEGQFIIGELQGFEGMDINALADLLEQEAAKAVAEEMRDCFEYSKMLRADILGLGNDIQQRHPDQWQALVQNWEERYARISLATDVTLEFVSTGALREGLEMGAAR